MFPTLSLALAAMYSPPGRYGFPSGKAILPVATVGTPDDIYSRQVSLSARKGGSNADLLERPTLTLSDDPLGGRHDVTHGCGGHIEGLDHDKSKTIYRARDVCQDQKGRTRKGSLHPDRIDTPRAHRLP